MTDAEQIEVWQKEFEDWAYDYPGDALSKKYLLQAWVAAKRSQPVIELSIPDCHCFDEDTKKDVWSYTPDAVHNAIKAAGYKYKVKE